MEYRILGPVAAIDQGHQIDLGGPRERALLARLLLSANLVVPADTLIDDLWSGNPPEHATATLRVYISRLRRALGTDAHRLVTQSPGYRLTLGPQQLDASRFATLVHAALGDLAAGRPEAAAAGLRQALGLWQGDALADLADLPFARAEVSRLEEARLTAIESRVDADLACGLHVSVAGELDGLVARHPLREKLSGQRMLARYRCGRQADALAAYSELRERLAADLGVDPSPQLQLLHLAILRHEARPASARGSRLPAQTTSFIGREAELATIDELLALSRLVTLTGPSGSGKSRLALHAARQAQGKFPGGTWLIELAPVIQPDLVVFSVARALSVGETPSTALIDSIVAALADSDALLVLDNSEHLLEAVATFATTVLRACPGLHILATSQSKLNVPGEATWPVPPLTLPSAVESDQHAIAATESVRLFCDRARLARPGFALTPASALDVRDICRRLDGIPLAIELAAARVGALTASQLAARLDDRFGVLTGGSPAGLPRHRTLAAAIEWSYELLSETEQACLRRLARFAGGCTIDAAEHVCGDDQVPGAQVFDLVTTLIDRSLLTVQEQAGRMRYGMLESIRQYAAGRLEPGELTSTHRRQLAWLLDLTAEADLDGPDQAAWLDALDAERANVRAALDWSLGVTTPDGGRTPELAMALAGVMAPFWAVRGPVAQGRRWLDAALAAAGDTAGARSRAVALDGAAQLATVQADYDAALGYQRESLAIWRGLGELPKIARSLGDIGAIAHLRSDYAAARAMYAESIELAEQAGADQEVARCLSGLGRLALHQNDLDSATAYYEQAMARFTASGDLRRATLILGNLGVVALHAGHFERARDRLEQHLANARRLGDRKLIGGALTNLGMAFYYSRDFDSAGQAHEEALHLAEQHGDRRMQQVVLVNLGLVALARGDYAESVALHRRSLALAASFREPRAIAECLEEQAQAEAGAGHASRAAVLIGASEALRLTIGSPIPDSDQARFARAATASAAELGPARFAELRAAGAAMPTPAVVAFAQSDSPQPPPR